MPPDIVVGSSKWLNMTGFLFSICLWYIDCMNGPNFPCLSVSTSFGAESLPPSNTHTNSGLGKLTQTEALKCTCTFTLPLLTLIALKTYLSWPEWDMKDRYKWRHKKSSVVAAESIRYQPAESWPPNTLKITQSPTWYAADAQIRPELSCWPIK